MKHLFPLILLFFVTNLVAQQPLPPDRLFKDLFRDVQLAKVFPDGKTFVDAVPRKDPTVIVEAYKKLKVANGQGFSLEKFVKENFDIPPSPPAFDYVMQQKFAADHIKNLWTVLQRPSDEIIPGASLLALPKPYLVPGGRFREIYYWDSYFTMLGLKVHEQTDVIENMVSNFAWLIHTYGHIPNGSRTYYLSRSQPPFFSLMVELLATVKGDEVYKEYLPALKKEYDYWMDKSAATKHVVLMPDGSKLNRYYDRDAIPRQESYAEDVALAENAKGRKKDELYRDMRSGAESGWDFSSRWFADGKTLSTIETTNIIPVDLNCLLYKLEERIADAENLYGTKEQAKKFKELATARKKAILFYCWNAEKKYFSDYNIRLKKTNNHITASTLYPLYMNIASNEQAAATLDAAARWLLKPGGIVSTTVNTGQQWDAPNGWAPQQWVAVQAAVNYGRTDMAKQIAKNWLSVNDKVYRATGKMMEKYNVEDLEKEAGGGEYPAQDGFGWTNGVYIALKALFPEL